MLQIQLHHGAPAARWINLRELRGHDEAMLEAGDPWATTALLGRLVSGPEAQSFDLWGLSVSDRDRLAAGVYQQLYGPRVQSSVACGACEEDMDIDFALVDLMREPDFAGLDAVNEDEDGVAAWSHERLGRVRPPTLRDQVELSRWQPTGRADELARRCCQASDEPLDAQLTDELEKVLERIAPTMDVDLASACPECGEAQDLRFDLHSYLGASLMRERRFLTHEVHRLACAYGWGLDQIYSLRRDERRDFVRLIEREGRGLRR